LIRQQHLAGFEQGTYVRVLIRRVPREFTTNFRPQTPVILGGLLPHETLPSGFFVLYRVAYKVMCVIGSGASNGDQLGFLNARVKRHRWHRRILKSNDPLIFSVGWRRFQVSRFVNILPREALHLCNVS